jgi:hypothetical protein
MDGWMDGLRFVRTDPKFTILKLYLTKQKKKTKKKKKKKKKHFLIDK